MEYHIKLFYSVNDLVFGMDKEDVRRILGSFTIVGNRDMFLNCFAEYHEDKLVSIEAFGDFKVIINDVVFTFSDDIEEANRKMLLIDPDAEIIHNESGAVSRKYSIATYFENGFEAFLIGIENYYGQS